MANLIRTWIYGELKQDFVGQPLEGQFNEYRGWKGNLWRDLWRTVLPSGRTVGIPLEGGSKTIMWSEAKIMETGWSP